MSFTSTAGFSKNTKGTSAASASAESGSGGGIMDIWTQERVPKLNSLLAVQADNQSSFALPAGLVNTSGFSSFSSGEKPNGYGVDGQVLDTDSTPLGGVGAIYRDGTAVATQSFTGVFLIAAPPPTEIEVGADGGSLGTYSFAFQPDADGILAEVDPITLTDDHQTNIVYGRVEGTVTDAEGKPVEGAVVGGKGQFTKSAGDGTYSLLGPGGITATLAGLDGYTKDAVLNAGQTTTVDWQYAGVEVKVLLPGDEPAVNVPVDLGATGERIYTDESGVAAFYLVTPDYGDTVAVVFQETVLPVNVGGEGLIAQETLNQGVGFQGQVAQAVDGELVRDVTVEIEGEQTYRSKTDEHGRFTVGTPETGELTLRIGVGDRRYLTTEVALTATNNVLATADVDLQRRKAIWGT